MSHSRTKDVPETNYFSHCWGVFEGGGVRAAAHAGAFQAAREAGITFGRLAGTSAGSIIAAFIAAGATHQYITQALLEVDLSSLKVPATFKDSVFSNPSRRMKLVRNFLPSKLKSLANISLLSGLYSSIPLEQWVEEHLQTLLSKRRLSGVKGFIKFSELTHPLHVVATNLTTGTPKVWSNEKTPEDSVAAAVRCSCNIPFFYQAVYHQSSVLIDGGAVSNLPSFVFSELLDPQTSRNPLSRILAFRLLDDVRQDSSIGDISEFAMRLSSAAIDSASHIQQTLQPHVYQISIPTGSIKSTDFDKVKDIEKKTLHQAGVDAVRTFISRERLTVRQSNSSTPYRGFDEKMMLLVQELTNCSSHFYAVENSTYWMDFLFPTILSAARRGISMTIISSSSDNQKEQRRRWLFQELGGIIIQPETDLNFEGFVFDPDSVSGSVLLSAQPSPPRSEYVSERTKLYTRDSDPAILELVCEKLFKYKSSPSKPRSLPYSECADKDIFDKLRNIPHYQNSKFKLVDIEVNDDILSLQKSIKEYKILQIKQHIHDLREHNRDFFEPIEVCLPNGGTTIVTPPILEKVHDKYVIIEGNARLFYCLNNNITNIRAIVVEDVRSPLPAENPRPISCLKLVSSTATLDEIYQNHNQSLFRKIEEAIHPFPH